MTDVLLERVRDQGEHFLVLVEQQHCPQISQSLVRETRRGQEFQAFYLAKVCSFAQCEEVEEFRDIVPPGET